MTLFRRRKNAGAATEKHANASNNKSVKEKVLQGQVDDLQEEMKRLNQRLVEMQTNAQQNTGSPTKSTVNVPSFSMRSGNAANETTRSMLSSDQYLRNQSLRKKKGMEDVFVPCEIDFVSNQEHSGKNRTHRPELKVSNIFEEEPPVRVIETRKTFSINGSSHSNRALHKSKQPQVFGDAESTASSQKSAYTMKNGRKVRRIVRKVRAAPPLENSSNTSSNNASKSRASELTIRGHRKGRSSKRGPNKHSQIEISDIFMEDSKTSSFSREGSTNRNPIQNDNGVKTYSTNVRVEKKSSQINKSMQNDTNPKSSLLADIRSGIKLNKVTKPAEQNLPPKLDSHRGVLREDTNRSNFKTSTVTSSHSPANLLEPRTVATARTKSQTPKNSLLEGIKAGVELKQVDRTTEKPKLVTTQNPRSSLLEGIKAGVKLKQVDTTAEKPQRESQNPKSALLEGIKAGVKLKQVDRSSLQNKKKQETPMSALLANIQKRKQECLRQEDNTEQSGIDW